MVSLSLGCTRRSLMACCLWNTFQPHVFWRCLAAFTQALLIWDHHIGFFYISLNHSHNPRKNIAKEEAQAFAELRKDQSRVILTDDKGVALVVMDRTECNNKVQELLEDGGTYKVQKLMPMLLIGWPLSEMADVIAIVLDRMANFLIWLMLLPLWQME